MANTNQFSRGNSIYEKLVIALLLFCLDAVNKARLGITTADNNIINPLYTAYISAYAVSKVKSTASPSNRETTKLARAALTAKLRPYVQKWFYKNNLATNQDILDAGLTELSSGHGPYGKPTLIPKISAEFAPARIINITYKQPDGRKAKPAGVCLNRSRFWVGPNPPTSVLDWPRFKDTSKNPTAIQFDDTQIGMPVIIASCYVGTNGDEGDYSKTITTTVPGT